MIRKIIVVSLLVSGAYATDKMLDLHTLHSLKQQTKVLRNPRLTIKEGMDKESVYFLKIEKKMKKSSRIITAFVDKKTGAVYFGSGYDKEGKKMRFPKDVSVIREGISFSYGTGKKELYLFTDPECPYCIKFEKAAQGKLGNYTVHVFFYPLPYHKKAPAMIEWIMQAPTDLKKKERLDKVMVEKSMVYQSLMQKNNKSFTYTSPTKIMIEKARKAAAEFGVRGTPATFDGSFEPVVRSKLLRNTSK